MGCLFIIVYTMMSVFVFAGSMTDNNTTSVQDEEIAAIGYGSSWIPLRVRVLRKWSPTFRPTETCFQLIDKQVCNFKF